MVSFYTRKIERKAYRGAHCTVHRCLGPHYARSDSFVATGSVVVGVRAVDMDVDELMVVVK
jgi:hypothetical protein